MTRLSRQMDSDAALVITIFTYTAIAFANWYWALAPLLGLAIFLAVRMQFPHPEKQRSRVRVHLTARVLLPLLLVLAFANTTEEAAVYQGAYLACAAVTLWFCLRVFLACRQVGPPRIRAAYAALAGAGTSLVLVLPPWILQEAAPGALAGIVGMCTLLAVFHEWTLPTGRLWTTEDFWTIPRTLLACCAIAGILLLQQFEIIPQWPDILTFPKQIQE